LVQDVGRAVNPLTLRGQMIGSLVWARRCGAGYLQYDDEGRVSPARLPTICCRPRAVQLAVLCGDYPSPINPLGAKGAGEGGIVAAGGAIANAVANAPQSFGVEARQSAHPDLYLGASAGQATKGGVGADGPVPKPGFNAKDQERRSVMGVAASASKNSKACRWKTS
jgi:hypothetical protein